MHLCHRYVLFRNMLIRTHKLISAIWKLDHSYSLVVLLICNLIGSVTGIGIYDLNVSLCLRFLLFSNQSELQRPLPLWANDEYRDLIFWKYQCCPPPLPEPQSCAHRKVKYKKLPEKSMFSLNWYPNVCQTDSLSRLQWVTDSHGTRFIEFWN